MIDIDRLKLIINDFSLAFTNLKLKHFIKSCNIDIIDQCVNIYLKLGFYFPQSLNDQLADALQEEVNKQTDDVRSHFNVQLHITTTIATHNVQTAKASHPNIKNIILVASGKGGVGKSTVTANLALALESQGASVGVLDADIYGPSQPQLMGNYQAPDKIEDKKFTPLEAHGVYMMSIGNLVDLNSAMIWRGPMVSQALKQLLNDTKWPELDYLLIDLPPGTGDIQLTIAKEVPVAGSVVVTTPQDLSLIDARRAIEMFRKVGISVLGIIENMSTYICPKCNHQENIFGYDGGERLALNVEVPLLAKIPLNMTIRENSDNGKPTVIANKASIISDCFEKASFAFAAFLSLKTKNHNRRMPEVKVELSKE